MRVKYWNKRKHLRAGVATHVDVVRWLAAWLLAVVTVAIMMADMMQQVEISAFACAQIQINCRLPFTIIDS